MVSGRALGGGRTGERSSRIRERYTSATVCWQRPQWRLLSEEARAALTDCCWGGALAVALAGGPSYRLSQAWVGGPVYEEKPARAREDAVFAQPWIQGRGIGAVGVSRSC